MLSSCIFITKGTYVPVLVTSLRALQDASDMSYARHYQIKQFLDLCCKGFPFFLKKRGEHKEGRDHRSPKMGLTLRWMLDRMKSNMQPHSVQDSMYRLLVRSTARHVS